MLEGPWEKIYLMGYNGVKQEDACKRRNVVAGVGALNRELSGSHSEKLRVSFPPPSLPSPGGCRCASPNLGCTFSGYRVPLLCSTSDSTIILFFCDDFMAGCFCTEGQTTCALAPGSGRCAFGVKVCQCLHC